MKSMVGDYPDSLGVFCGEQGWPPAYEYARAAGETGTPSRKALIAFERTTESVNLKNRPNLGALRLVAAAKARVRTWL